MSEELRPARDGVEADECSWAGSASLSVLASTPAEECARFRDHLADGCVACAVELAQARQALAELDALGDADVGPEPPAGLRERLLERVRGEGRPQPDADAAAAEPELRPWTAWDAAPGIEIAPGLRTLCADEAAWVQTAVPGVAVRQLARDAVERRVTMLVRMQPGSSYPPHRHAAAEQCLVLSGSLDVAGQRLTAGDFQEAGRESLHEVQSTEEGCTLLIVSSQDDELLPVG